MFVRNQVLRGARGIAGLRNASCLVIAEHDTKSITQGTLAAVTAGSKIGDVSLLVFGSGIDNVAKSATTIKGVSKVISVENAVSYVNFVLNNSKYFLFYLQSLKDNISESVANAIAKLAPGYTHILAPASNNSKNYLPRAAALFDSSPITDVSAVISEDTFKRPMYAGNAIATVKMSDKLKVIFKSCNILLVLRYIYKMYDI